MRKYYRGVLDTTSKWSRGAGALQGEVENRLDKQGNSDYLVQKELEDSNTTIQIAGVDGEEQLRVAGW